MGKFVTRTLGEICDEVDGVIRTGPFGSQLHESDYQDEGVPVVMPKNIIDGRISVEGIARIGDEDVARLSQHKLQKGDIVYGRRGDIGRRALITEREDGWLCGTGSLRVSLGDSILDPRFLYYYLGQPTVTAWIANQAIGATLPNLNTSIIHSIPITYPPLALQRKIADILSAYDDLIENNTRRIKILEEMARTVYREWFVHFRFPGHEKVKLVDSPSGKTPAGWNVLTLGDVLQEIESGSRPKGGIDAEERGIPSIGAENVLGLGQYDYSKEKFVSQRFYESMRRGHVQNRDVLLYKDGAQIGRKTIFGDGFPHETCCINEHVFALRTNDRCTQAYLFFWLDQPEMTQAICNLNANAAQPGLNQMSVKGLPIILPPKSLLDEFDKPANQALGLIFNLAKKTNVLRGTRDLLLPKLILGEINLNSIGSS